MNQTPLDWMLTQFAEPVEVLRGHLGRFGISGSQQLTSMGKLSGGIKARIAYFSLRKLSRASEDQSSCPKVTLIYLFRILHSLRNVQIDFQIRLLQACVSRQQNCFSNRHLILMSDFLTKDQI